MNNVRRMNDLVAVRHMKLMKLNVLSLKKTAVVVVRSSTCDAPLRTTELTFPEQPTDVMDYSQRCWADCDSAAIRGDLLISDTQTNCIA